MKKLAAVVAAAALSLTMAACGGENNDANIINDEVEQNTEEMLNETGNELEETGNEIEGEIEEETAE